MTDSHETVKRYSVISASKRSATNALNAILNRSTGSLEGAKLYVTLFPCNECAKAIIQCGIKEIVYGDDKYAGSDSVVASKKMFDMVGIKYTKYTPTGRTFSIEL